MTSTRLWRTFTAQWQIKVFLGGAITAAFWIGYSLLEHFPARPVVQMPELGIDRLIPFWPRAAFVYVSQFVTMPLVIWLMTTRRQLLFCCLNLVLLIGASFVVFYFWPTSVARPEPSPGHDFFYGVIANADLPRNACPSLHAAFGVFTAIGAWQVFRGWQHSRWLIGVAWLWTAAVLLSTLLIKQHVFLDLLAGIALGAASGWLTQRSEKPLRRRNPACIEVVSHPPMRAAASLPASAPAPELTTANTRPPGGPS